MRYVGALLVMTSTVAGPAAAQDQPKEPSAQVTLQVDVTLIRQQGQKTISSAPYTLLMIPGDQSTRVRTNLQVPLPVTTVTPPADGKPAVTTQTTRYETIGTSIDANARNEGPGSGRYRISVSITDSAIYPPADATVQKPGSPTPALRSFSSANTAILRDGQTTEFTAATDKVTGEFVKVQVKLTVLK
jgi:hypothetical protein